MTSRPFKPEPLVVLPGGTLPALVLGGSATALVGWLAVKGEVFGSVGVVIAAVVYALTALVVVTRIGPFHAAPVFGAPNGVTLGRAVATALIAGYVGECALGYVPTPQLALAVAAFAAAAILADGLDGWMARRRGPATVFGARFDMEIDALLILVLSTLAVALDKAGAWALLIGALRYLFVAAGVLVPALTAPLPPSFRRKAVCVLQGAALCLLALPAVGPALGTPIAAAALAALVWSFAVDVRWLLRAGGAS